MVVEAFGVRPKQREQIEAPKVAVQRADVEAPAGSDAPRTSEAPRAHVDTVQRANDPHEFLHALLVRRAAPPKGAVTDAPFRIGAGFFIPKPVADAINNAVNKAIADLTPANAKSLFDLR